MFNLTAVRANIISVLPCPDVVANAFARPQMETAAKEVLHRVMTDGPVVQPGSTHVQAVGLRTSITARRVGEHVVSGMATTLGMAATTGVDFTSPWQVGGLVAATVAGPGLVHMARDTATYNGLYNQLFNPKTTMGFVAANGIYQMGPEYADCAVASLMKRIYLGGNQMAAISLSDFAKIDKARYEAKLLDFARTELQKDMFYHSPFAISRAMAVTRLLLCLSDEGCRDLLGQLLANPNPCVRFVVARSLLLLHQRQQLGLQILYYMTEDGKNAAQVYGETLSELPSKPRRIRFDVFRYPDLGIDDVRFAYVPLLAEYQSMNPNWRDQLGMLRGQAKDRTVTRVVNATLLGNKVRFYDYDDGDAMLMSHVESLFL